MSKGQVQNFVAFYLRDRDETKAEGFGNYAEKDRVLKLFSHIHPNLIRIVGLKAENILYWLIYERAPLSTFAYGRTLLIGDAGHPMTPFTAEGTAQTLEDAGALLGIFSNLTVKGKLPKFPAMYEKVRLARAGRVQSSSSTPLKGGKPNPLVEKKLLEKADVMLPKGLSDKEKGSWDFRYFLGGSGSLKVFLTKT